MKKNHAARPKYHLTDDAECGILHKKREESEMRRKLPQLTSYIDAPTSPLSIALLTDLHRGKIENPQKWLAQAEPQRLQAKSDKK